MRFLESFGPEINPYTGYPFRKENLDERIARILGDDSDETPAVPQPSVQPIEINIAEMNRYVHNAVTSPVYECQKTPYKRSVVPCSIQNNTKERYKIFKYEPIQPIYRSIDFFKKYSVYHGNETKDERPSSIQNNAKDKYQIQPTKMDDTALSNRSKVTVKGSHVLPTKDMKNKRPVAPSSSSGNDRYEIIKIQPTKTDSASLNRSVDSIKKSPMLPNKETKDEPPIIPPPAKRIKLEYKHSFNFIRANTADMIGNGTKSEKKRHRAIFRHFEDWMKIEERKKAYKKLSDITKILWPNPRDVTTDEKVTALNVNEFKKDDIYRMMVDLALNDPNLFEAHEVIYAKNLKSSGKPTI